MKKTICFLTAICIMLMSGCSITKGPDNINNSKPISNTLTDKGIELIAKVDRLAKCEEYISLFSSNDDVEGIIHNITDNDYTKPQGIFIIENLDEIVFENMMPEAKLPGDITQILKEKLSTALPSQITAINGAMSLAATSILSYKESFIYKGLKNPAIYLYTYGNDYSFMVNYNPNDENIVDANVAIVINDKLSKCISKDDVVGFFKDDLNYDNISVSVAKEEK